jgi:hypothetical protein
MAARRPPVRRPARRQLAPGDCPWASHRHCTKPYRSSCLFSIRIIAPNGFERLLRLLKLLRPFVQLLLQ